MPRFWLYPLVGALLVLAASGSPVRADAQVDQILEKVRNLNPGLVDYQADVEAHVKARIAIIPYSFQVLGRYYHKRPDRHKLEATRAPNYVRKYPQFLGLDVKDAAKFHSTAQEAILDGQPVWHITMLPKEGMGDIQKFEVWVNQENYTVPRLQTSYKNNGRLLFNIKWTRLEGYWVVSEGWGEFDFPSVSARATAHGKYGNYRFNQNLPDSFFEEKK
ncbi:MAG TPA: hypothetical protein VNO81_14670 [Candidatus Nitrosotenuis sp.]|nr:hypothetical protein [Candidatus Nitrosotenuis sp.]